MTSGTSCKNTIPFSTRSFCSPIAILKILLPSSIQNPTMYSKCEYITGPYHRRMKFFGLFGRNWYVGNNSSSISIKVFGYKWWLRECVIFHSCEDNKPKSKQYFLQLSFRWKKLCAPISWTARKKPEMIFRTVESSHVPSSIQPRNMATMPSCIRITWFVGPVPTVVMIGAIFFLSVLKKPFSLNVYGEMRGLVASWT